MQNIDNQQLLQQCSNRILTAVQNAGGYQINGPHIDYEFGCISISLCNQNGINFDILCNKRSDGKFHISTDGCEDWSFDNIDEAFEHFNYCLNNEWKNNNGIDGHRGKRITDIIVAAGYAVSGPFFRS